MNNVTTDGTINFNVVTRVPADPGTITAHKLECGDVLFNNTNSVALVGKTALFTRHGEPVVFSNHFTRLRTHPGRLEPAFLAYWLRGQWCRGLFADICNRWIGQAAVQRDKLLALELPLPPLAEQKRIVAVLNEQMAAVERARAAAEAQLAGMNTLPAALLRRAFDGEV